MQETNVKTLDTSLSSGLSLPICSGLAVAMDDQASPPASSGYSQRWIPCQKPCHADCSAFGSHAPGLNAPARIEPPQCIPADSTASGDGEMPKCAT
ncbi:hypothetical protein TUN199_04272 [Pyrenophora tritici-repentis]|nr:hypothetical protein PtrV1_12477 [Pyrenophora tritici-repentis]KAI0580725.1 hypothetical protein Alg215_05061 [Pyrenophora tritici-repentis]KAI0586824.1 hypothetical protein Alg130_04088 [Pyrenophora tritici-repentis]KAI0611483.1 hypothetical protein TUN205_04274 [Pyrenophora tritici-repentis]KAI0623724.1 hypothetical protein TUN199_04272 [Pyrenophora tritici-repentis]